MTPTRDPDSAATQAAAKPAGGTDDNDFKLERAIRHAVAMLQNSRNCRGTSISCSTRFGNCGKMVFPLIVSRHSMQIPMPQSGPRGCASTDE